MSHRNNHLTAVGAVSILQDQAIAKVVISIL
jgi:hypothetical protein